VAVLRPTPDGASALLIERTERDDDAASGQVALPGGHRDPEDASVEATALRELHEEVGLAPQDVARPLRYLGTYPARAFELEVAAFATILEPTAHEAFAAAPEEVATVFWLPHAELRRTRPVTRTTRFGPREVEAVVFDGHVLWGFTRRLLAEAVDRLYPLIEAAPSPEEPSAGEGSDRPR
jgi:8-oxo-dGTP pyrophosphatase MutT (NUDIX family)